MTVLPYLDTKATPIRSTESPRISRAQSFHVPEATTTVSVPQPPSTTPKPRRQSSKLNSSSPIRTSIPPARTRTPKIRIVARTDEILKQLPHSKTTGADLYHAIWKPMTRDPPDYDYLWEPVQREDIRHQYDDYVPPPRIVASRPDEPIKMTTMFETQDRHYHNYKRVQAMQQRQWNREHMQYTIFPYAHGEERELYNKQLRETLKEQMEQKVQTDKAETELRNRATQMIIDQDRQYHEQERQRKIERARFLMQFTAKNKELMENKWDYDQWNRLHQWHVERAILADDPINWSKTMT